MKLKKTKRMKIALMMIVLLALSLIACSKTSQVTFEIQDARGFPMNESTVILENHNGNPANVYTRSTDTTSVTFVDLPHGTYTVRIRQDGFTEYTYPALEVKSARIVHQATLHPTRENIVFWAGREWRILDKQDSKALLITERIVGERRFDERSNVWANSEIRRYLNGEFFDTFNETDKAKITEHITGDKVFLLSIDEALQYFSSNTDRVALDSRGQISWWLLRSPGGATRNTREVILVGPQIMTVCRVYDDTGGVRPALWLNL